MTIQLPTITREQLYAPGIKAFHRTTLNGQDPTSLPVQFAFPAMDAKPTDDAWLDGEWLDGEGDISRGWTATFLLDLIADLLTGGEYDIWLRVLGADEQPTRRVGQLIVT